MLVKLLLQNDFQLLDAAVDAIPAHFLHNGFPHLRKRRQTSKFTFQVSNAQANLKISSGTHFNVIFLRDPDVVNRGVVC